MISKGTTVLDFIKNLSGDLKDSFIKVFKDGLSEIDYGIPNQDIPDFEFYAYSDIERISDLKEVSSSIIKDTNFVTDWFYDDDGFEIGSETVIELYI